jgi:flagellar basal-body rod modification protein FlgD
MAVNTIGSNATTTQALIDASKSTDSASSSNAMTDAQNRFLKLLTTQLKNQDPLNPMDNAQMTSQLAQISTVDGIEKLNATLQKLVANSVDGEAMQAANLVGRQVMIAGSGLQLGDNGAAGGVELAAAADQVLVTIKDPNGLVMKTIDLGNLEAGIHNFTWDGTTDAGAQAVNGGYSVAVAARRGTEKVTASALQLTGVTNINRSTQGVTLNLGSLGLVTLSDLKQIF